MRLLVLNGSPRGPRSNTDVLLDPLVAGFTAAGGELTGRLHLVRSSHADEAVRAFPSADAVLLAFPLYCDALPAPAVGVDTAAMDQPHQSLEGAIDDLS